MSVVTAWIITSMLLYLQDEGYTENECGYCLDDNLYVVIFTERRIYRERVWLLPG